MSSNFPTPKDGPNAINLKNILPPLSPFTYYRRNAARTLPVGGAIAISVFLIASIVTLLNSVDQSITVNYNFLQRFSSLATQYERDVPKPIIDKAKGLPQVDYVIDSIPYFITIRAVFGQMPVPIYAVSPADAKEMAQRTGNKLVAGHWPGVNAPEIVLSRAWANNKGARIGDKIDVKNERLPALTEKQELVGILEGGDNLALTDKSYVLLEMPAAVVRNSYLFFPKTKSAMPGLNDGIAAILKTPEKYKVSPEKAQYIQLYTYAKLVKELRDNLGFLYTFLAVADILVIGAVALLSGFLANIYFEQRLAEFGLLSAFGFRREALARRLVIESGALVVAGWLVGLLISWVAFRVLDNQLMVPRGLVLAHINATALLYTLPTPFLVGVASLGTVLLRLYRLDPIEIMERR